MSGRVTQLGYVGLGVSDLAAWRSFGTELLGLEVAHAYADALHLRMDEYLTRIVVTPSGEDDLIFAGWQVPNRSCLDEITQRLVAGGTDVKAATADELATRGVQSMVWFEDSDGLRTELAVGQTRASDPFVPGRSITGFKAGEQGLGHIVVRVDDRDRAEAFYTQLLGLRVSDYGSGRLAFLNCNPRHHSIAFAPRAIIPGPKRLVHLMIELRSIDDVGTAMDACERLGYFIPETLGRHTNDEMLSFYIESPSGFQIEYGYGAREVPADGPTPVYSYGRKDVWGHKRISR